jgi:hypothetical protein
MSMRRRPAVFALCALSLAATLVVGRPSASAADVADDTLQRIASCLHERHALSIVMLVDTSGSLKSTDPSNDRIAAARLALSNFASLAALKDNGRVPKIEVLLAGFSSRFEAIVPWTTLTPKSQTTFDGPLLSFANRNEGIDTDFPTALIGAQRELSGRARRACRAVLLFTDGKYDVVDGGSQARIDAGLTKEYAPGISLDDSGSSDQVEALGREFLCRSGGLADSLRRDKITLVTLALAARIEPEDQQFLRALSEGTAAATTCGTERTGTGAYLAAAQLSELKQQFNRVTTAIAGGRAVTSAGEAVEVCARDACDAGRHAVPVDAAADRVSLLVDTGGSGVDAAIELPDGAGTIDVTAGEPGEAVIDEIAVRWTWVDDHTLNIDADLPGNAGQAGAEGGDWNVILVQRDGAPTGSARIDTYLYNGWEPHLYLDAFLLEGIAQTVRLEILDSDGDVVNANDYRGTVALTAKLRVGDGDAQPLQLSGPDARGRYSFDFEAPPDSGGSTAQLQLTLDVTTAQGVELAPSSTRTDLEVRLPDAYPTITTSLLDLGSSRGAGRVVGTIEVVGGRDRRGCAWVTDVRFDEQPEGVGGIEWSASNITEEGCERVLAGATEIIDFELQPENAVHGFVRGEVDIAYHAGEDTEIRTVTVPVELQLLPPIDQSRRLGLFVVIMIIGVGAPLLALYLMNRLLARFATVVGLQVARVPIAAPQTFRRLMTLSVYDDAEAAADVRTIARINPEGGLSPLTLTPLDCAPFDTSRAQPRQIRHDELVFRSRTERNPFTAPYAEVQSERPIAAGPRPGRDSTIANIIPLALAGSWFIVLPEQPADVPDGWVAAEVVVFLAGDDLAAELAAATQSLGEQAGRLVNVLHDLHEGISTADRVGPRS